MMIVAQDTGFSLSRYFSFPTLCHHGCLGSCSKTCSKEPGNVKQESAKAANPPPCHTFQHFVNIYKPCQLYFVPTSHKFISTSWFISTGKIGSFKQNFNTVCKGFKQRIRLNHKIKVLPSFTSTLQEF